VETNFIGLTAAAASFLGIWLGHVSVRKFEREVERLWIPCVLALVSGSTLEIVSFRTSSLMLSTICGILGVTLLWDSLEFYRQQDRIKAGHAPANSHNPRHMRILADHPAATTLDWLDRDPRGVPFSAEELRVIKDGAK
jgi:hypothetical protein